MSKSQKREQFRETVKKELRSDIALERVMEAYDKSIGKKNNNPWPQAGDKVWLASATNSPQQITWLNTPEDKFCKTINLISKTKKGAQEIIDRTMRVAEIREWIEEKNEGWKPTFTQSIQKWYLHCYHGQIKIGYSTFSQSVSKWKLIKSEAISEALIKKFSKARLIEFIEA